MNVRHRDLGAVGASLLLVALSVLFWKLRIFDSGTDPTIEIGPVDLYISHVPMKVYGFEELRRGSIPLWNPFQFCGEPYLAMQYHGLLYPLHLYSLFVDVLASLEISFVLHMSLGAVGMWLLARRLGLSFLGGLAAAATFIWSGWIIHNNIQPNIFAALNWLPLTVLLVDRVLSAARFSHLALILGLTLQILLGATEVLLHTMYVAAGFTACRLLQRLRRGEAADAARRGAAVVACIAAAVLLAAPQLLPTLELVGQSSRAGGSLTFEQASWGAVAPAAFFRGAVEGAGAVNVGLLPLLGLPLLLGFRRQRFLSLFCVVTAVTAALLVFGGPVYRAYYSLPFVGDLFRRPIKFLDAYVFAQALIAGLAVTRLDSWVAASRRRLWSQAGWLLCVAVAVAALGWTGAAGLAAGYWLAAVALLALFGLVTRPALRRAVIAGLCVLQGASLFLRVGDDHVRPVKRPEIYESARRLLDPLRRDVGAERVYLSPWFWFSPGLTAKQGMLRRMNVSIDYEPLAVSRYQRFFESITPGPEERPSGAFDGSYPLRGDSRWKLMDLTSTRYLVLHPNEPGVAELKARPAEFRTVRSGRSAVVFERRRALPRAYVVAAARTVAGDEALDALASADFDPRREVLLEGPTPAAVEGRRGARAGKATVLVDEPERVVVRASAPEGGFLVLTDLFYPGWQAFIDDRQLEIRRANYLFRAIELPPGQSEVHFVYRPASFRNGVALSASTLAVLLALLVWPALSGRFRRTPRLGTELPASPAGAS